VKSQEPENEKLLVAVTVSLAIERFNFVICAFHAPIVDRVLPPIQDTSPMYL
jgi:hypothetical protein